MKKETIGVKEGEGHLANDCTRRTGEMSAKG